MNPGKLGDLLDFLERKTGKNFSGRTFDSRLRIQKAVYLLRAFGYGPAKKYPFNSYFHGPYSPELTKDYYPLVEGKASPSGGSVVLPPRALPGIVEAIGRGNDFLEAATTLHMVKTHNRSLSRREALQRVAVMKPHLPTGLLEDAWEWLTDQDLCGDT